MAIMEQQFVIHTEHNQYRIRPNPDTDAPDGRDGIVLEWREVGDDWREVGDEEWLSYFYVSPDAVQPLINALQALMKDVVA